jgi:hypothetical protein
MDQIVGGILDHLDLFNDNFLLALDVVRRERRVEDDVGKDVERQRQMLVEDLDVVARVFLRGKSVELSADRVDRLGDVFRTPGRRALEQHVLHEVSDTALLGRFVARSAGQPDADADRADLCHPLGEDTEPVIENVPDDR